MARSGATARDFATVAAKNLRNGSMNTIAQVRRELDPDEVLAARMVVDPLTRPMCSSIADGAAVALLMSNDAARRFDVDGPRVLGIATASGRSEPLDNDLTPVELSVSVAFERAGIGPDDVDVIEVHDAAAPAELELVERLGFVAAGDGPALARAGDLAVDGRVPVNPSGGLITAVTRSARQVSLSSSNSPTSCGARRPPPGHRSPHRPRPERRRRARHGPGGVCRHDPGDTMRSTADPPTTQTTEFLVVGAGVSGLYQLIRLRELGADVLVVDANDDLGGTWYWNRYPGARFDSESYTYGYSFSTELLAGVELDGALRRSGRDPALPELRRRQVRPAPPHAVRRARVDVGRLRRRRHLWRLTSTTGASSRAASSCRPSACCRCRRAALPRASTLPRAASFHTCHWPHGAGRLRRQAGRRDRHRRHRRAGDPRDRRRGRRADGVPAPTELVRAAPQRRDHRRGDGRHQGPLRRDLRPLRAHARRVHPRARPHARSSTCRSEERWALWEQLYGEPGFGIWLGNFRDTLWTRRPTPSSPSSSPTRSAPGSTTRCVAEKLIPKDHGFGMQRVPMETRYYEAYNRPTCTWSTSRRRRSSAITPTGIETTDGERDFDIIVYATGFDAVTGAFDRIDITGVGGRPLREKWADGPVTYLGIRSTGFPTCSCRPVRRAGRRHQLPTGDRARRRLGTDLFDYTVGGATTARRPPPRPRPRGPSTSGSSTAPAPAQGPGLVHRLQLERRGPREGHALPGLQRRLPPYRKQLDAVAASGYATLALS